MVYVYVCHAVLVSCHEKTKSRGLVSVTVQVALFLKKNDTQKRRRCQFLKEKCSRQTITVLRHWRGLQTIYIYFF